MNESLVSISELAERLRTTVTALHCRRHRSQFNLPPSLKLPGDRRVWFRAEVVDEWLANPLAFMPQAPRGPGRPRKFDVYTAKTFPVVAKMTGSDGDVKRGRGRPRKSTESQLNSR